MHTPYAGKLYHGTSEDNCQAILDEGLRTPEETGNGNWSEAGLPSRSNRVYLTDCYAPLYAAVAAEPGGRSAIIEIDVQSLDQGLLRADEDYSGHATLLGTDPDSWLDSLERLGTAAYEGNIVPAAMTRVAYFDGYSIASDSTLWQFTFSKRELLMVDVALHGRSGRLYRNWTSWLLDRQMDFDEVGVCVCGPQSWAAQRDDCVRLWQEELARAAEHVAVGMIP